MSRLFPRSGGTRLSLRSAVIAMAATVLLLAVTGNASAAVGGTLTPTADHDFLNRQVDGGPSTAKTFTVTSTGDTAGSDDLVIDQINLTGSDPSQFTFLETSSSRCIPGKVLTPNAKTCTIAVRFDPSETGEKSVGIEVVTNGPTLTSTGTIVGNGRDLEVTPETLEFGPFPAGEESPPQTVTITNRAPDPYTLGSISLNSGSTTNYEILSQTCSTSVALQAGESCTVSVKFKATSTAATPNSSVGQKSSALAVAGHGPNPIALVGETGAPAYRLDRASVYFGVDQPGGDAGSSETVTVSSTGNLPLEVTGVTLEGADSDQFLIGADGCESATIAGGQSCEIVLTHAASRAGWQTARLVIETNSSVSKNTVALSGRGAGETTDVAATGSLGLADRPLLRFQGDGRDAVSGVASGRCDLDGDGDSEIAMGATTWSRNPNTNDWEGAVYVTPGGGGIGGADLADRSGSTIIIPGEVLLPGQSAGNQTGSVACADVNGDGIDDLLIGAWAYQYEGRGFGTADARGAAYVVFGSGGFFTGEPVDLANLGGRGFQIVGDRDNELTVDEREAFDHLGYSLANLGDLNGDGRDEIGVLANTADTVEDGAPVRSNNGIAYVVPGQSSTQNVDLAVPGSSLAEIHGASPGSDVAPFGQFSGIDGVGDMNRDGVDDIALGAYTAVMFGRSTASGAVSVVSGSARGKVDLAESSSYLFAAGGAYAGNRFGISVAAAGDVNGDGIADLVAGGYPTSSANTGGAHVIFGSATPREGADEDGALDAAALGDRGYRVLATPGDRAGFSVDGVGDIDGDGLDDIVVGAEGTTANKSGTGWLIHGIEDPSDLPPSNDGQSGLVPVNPADTTAYIKTSSITGGQGSSLTGQTVGERFGRSVAGLGDVVGDGSAAIAFGSDSAYRLGRTSAGEVTVALYGGDPIPAPDPGPDPEPNPDPTRLKRASVISIKGPVKLNLRRARGWASVVLRCERRGVSCNGRVVTAIQARRSPRRAVTLGAGRSRRVSLHLSRAQTRILRGRFRRGVRPALRVTAVSVRAGARSVSRSKSLRANRGL